jgi:hypothetical protein
MIRHALEQLQGVADSLGSKGQIASKSRIQMIRSIQQGQNEEPCFATDKHYCCGKDCDWREDCRAKLSVWLS